jgi:porphobilinogen deaminase
LGFRVIGAVAATDGSHVIRAETYGPESGGDAGELGRALAGELLDRGAQQILAPAEIGR